MSDSYALSVLISRIDAAEKELDKLKGEKMALQLQVDQLKAKVATTQPGTRGDGFDVTVVDEESGDPVPEGTTTYELVMTRIVVDTVWPDGSQSGTVEHVVRSEDSDKAPLALVVSTCGWDECDDEAEETVEGTGFCVYHYGVVTGQITDEKWTVTPEDGVFGTQSVGGWVDEVADWHGPPPTVTVQEAKPEFAEVEPPGGWECCECGSKTNLVKYCGHRYCKKHYQHAINHDAAAKALGKTQPKTVAKNVKTQCSLCHAPATGDEGGLPYCAEHAKLVTGAPKCTWKTIQGWLAAPAKPEVCGKVAVTQPHPTTGEAYCEDHVAVIQKEELE